VRIFFAFGGFLTDLLYGIDNFFPASPAFAFKLRLTVLAELYGLSLLLDFIDEIPQVIE
jgi:hypothetical protein